MNNNKSPIKSLYEILGGIAFTGIMAGVGVLGYQCYVFFRFGQWTHFTIITALQLCKIEWAFYPYDWIGIHEIFNKIPLSFALIIAGAFLFCVAFCVMVMTDKP